MCFSHPNSHQRLGKFSIHRKYFNRAKFTRVHKVCLRFLKNTVLNVLKTTYSKLIDMHNMHKATNFIFTYSSLLFSFLHHFFYNVQKHTTSHCCYHFLSKFKLILKAKTMKCYLQCLACLCHCKPFTLIQKHTESLRHPGLHTSVSFSSLSCLWLLSLSSSYS